MRWNRNRDCPGCAAFSGKMVAWLVGMKLVEVVEGPTKCVAKLIKNSLGLIICAVKPFGPKVLILGNKTKYYFLVKLWMCK